MSSRYGAGGRRGVAAALAVGLVLSLGLAGCDDDGGGPADSGLPSADEVTGSESASSPSPITTPTPTEPSTPEPPTIPEAATKSGRAGAKAFVRFYIALENYAKDTGDVEPLRRIGLPASGVEVPAETLVNYETTVYTVPVDFARTVALLGYTVDLRAHASEFAWRFGDGQTLTTEDPGAPYPSDAITHTWEDAHRTFRPRVDTTYTVSYRVDGGPWLDLGDTVTVTGPESRVRIREASPTLS